MKVKLSSEAIGAKKLALSALATACTDQAQSAVYYSTMKIVGNGQEVITTNFDTEKVGLKPNELAVLPDETIVLIVGVSYDLKAKKPVEPLKVWVLAEPNHSAPGIFHWPGSTKSALVASGICQVCLD